MTQLHNAGFYSHYLFDLLPDLEKASQIEILPLLKTLSSFCVEEIIRPDKTAHPLPVDWLRLYAVYSNLISRGLPTLAPLYVERTLLRRIDTQIPIEEVVQNGSILFKQGPINRHLEQVWLHSLARAHALIQPAAPSSGQAPLWSQNLGLEAINLALAPFGVARLQKVLLSALMTSVISLDQPGWKIVVIERDVPCAELAIADFIQFLQAFLELQSQQAVLPAIEVIIYSTEELSGWSPLTNNGDVPGNITFVHRSLSIQNADYYNGDLLVDISLLQQNISTLPDDSFYDKHLHKDGAAFAVWSAQSAQGTRQFLSYQPILYALSKDSEKPLRFFLQNLFRKYEFRDGQFEILTRSLALKPVIGLLPTGGGKSLCYQMSALLQPGMTLIVDPLRSLMLDQYENLLNDYHIDAIEFINSQQNQQQRQEVLGRMAAGSLQFIFISPERLQNQQFRDSLDSLTTSFAIPYVVIDEAHCVSEWGHDFRTSYLNLAKTVQKYCRYHDHPPIIIALTGTASFAVLTDVQREIGIYEEEAKVLPQTFDRKELHFEIHEIPSTGKRKKLEGILRGLPQKFNVLPEQFFSANGQNEYPGIIFAPHVNGAFGVYELYTYLNQRLNICTEYYSGQTPKVSQIVNGRRHRVPLMETQDYEEYKIDVQRRFKRDDFPLLVSTKAFGMGIDKPNVRYTVHINIPQSLEAFYQEAGRAGRDGDSAFCYIIFSDDNPANANQSLDTTRSIDDLDAIPEPSYYQRGDIHRLLWLHKNSFQGLKDELKQVEELLTRYVYPKLKEIPTGGSDSIQIPFGFSDQQRMKREKAIYRLSIIGVVTDYTLDYYRSSFDVNICRREVEENKACLRRYIQRYKTRQDSDYLIGQIQAVPGNGVVEKCVRVLLKFVYEEVEKKRRAAIRTMAEVARKGADSGMADDFIRQELLAYLEKSPFSEPLENAARTMESLDWWSILEIRDSDGVRMLSYIDGARQLLGGCRRVLESYPDHPGIYLLSALARLLLPETDVESALNDIRSGLDNLQRYHHKYQEQVILEWFSQFEKSMQSTHNYLETRGKVAEFLLRYLPSRGIARACYEAVPLRAQNVLLNHLLQDVRSLSSKLRS
jgi:superfamily II DNA helicase RecQ